MNKALIKRILFPVDLSRSCFADHGKLAGTLTRNGGDCETVLDNFRKAGIDLEQLAADLQSQGAKSFDESWQNLLGAVESKGKELQHTS